jgi:DNA-binding response OmpR family regulator
MLRVRAAAGPSSRGGLRLPPIYLGPGLLLDEGRRSLRRPDDEVFLTPTEFDLLEALVAADGAIVADQALIARVWGDGAAVASQTLYAHVWSLRKKLGPAARIRRRYGIGYLMDPPA